MESGDELVAGSSIFDGVVHLGRRGFPNWSVLGRDSGLLPPHLDEGYKLTVGGLFLCERYFVDPKRIRVCALNFMVTSR